MPVEKVSAYRTPDGCLFEDEGAAEYHADEARLTRGVEAWVHLHLGEGLAYHSDLIDALVSCGHLIGVTVANLPDGAGCIVHHTNASLEEQATRLGGRQSCGCIPGEFICEGCDDAGNVWRRHTCSRLFGCSTAETCGQDPNALCVARPADVFSVLAGSRDSHTSSVRREIGSSIGFNDTGAVSARSGD